MSTRRTDRGHFWALAHKREYKARRYADRRSQRLCTVCGLSAENGALCDTHLEHAKLKERAKRASYRL